MGVGTSSGTEVTPSEALGVQVLLGRLLGPGWQVPLHRGAGPKAENDTSVLFILSLIFWGKIERMVFLDKETFSHQLVSKSQRTPDSEGTSSSVDRREDPLPSRLFSEMQKEFYTCVLTDVQLVPSLTYPRV